MSHNIKLLITDTFGKIVKTASSVSQPISIANLPEGLYIVVIYVDGKLSGKEKLIKL